MHSKPKVQLHKQKLKKKCLHKHKTNRKSSSEKLPTALPLGGGADSYGVNFDKKKNTSLMRARILYFLSFSSRETELHERIALAIIHFCC